MTARKKAAPKKAAPKKTAPKKTAPRKAGSKKAAPEAKQKVVVTGVRTLGAPGASPAAAPKRTKTQAASTEKAKQTLRAEFDKALALKEKLADEAAVGSREKGRDASRQEETLRSLVASLEGMSRFAIAMEMLTPAESRDLWAEAIRKGLYEGWRR